jgi:hypothetical protein
MPILLVSIGVAALALLLVWVPAIALQRALRLFAAPSAGDTSLMCERTEQRPTMEVASRPLELSPSSS